METFMKQPEKTLDAVMMHLILTGPKTEKKFNCQCMIPKDCLTMSKETLHLAYGEHLTQALYDLLHHKPFRKEVDIPKLVISS